MSEILFYHLTEQRLEQTLPGLLEKCLERGWRVVVQAGSEERRDALDAHLWTYRDESFLPHAAAGSASGDASEHPVWLCTDGENSNNANVRFMVDHASADGLNVANYERVIFMFDGNDEDAVAAAREQWKSLKDGDGKLTYWQQNEGRWAKKAEA